MKPIRGGSRKAKLSSSPTRVAGKTESTTDKATTSLLQETTTLPPAPPKDGTRKRKGKERRE